MCPWYFTATCSCWVCCPITRGDEIWDSRSRTYIIYTESQGPVGMVYDDESRRYVAILW